jgi:hypothetical protein
MMISLAARLFASRRPVLASFRNLHAGQRCFVMGNGPSLNNMELSLFKDEIVFGSNSCYLLFPRIEWRPTYWVCIDTRVLPDQAGRFVAMHEECPQIKMFMPSILLRHPERKVKAITSRLIPRAANRYYFREKPWQHPLPEGAFSMDMSRFLVSGYTVSITALQIAAYMGFNPIYLIGCDTSYAIPDSARQHGAEIASNRPGSKTEHKVPMYITGTADDDPNHFDPTYFGAGREYHAPNVEKMIWHYEQARAATEARGIRIVNATVGGKLEVFPRVDYAKLF